MHENLIDTPEDVERQLAAARAALRDFEAHVDSGRLLLRLHSVAPAHPLLLVRLLFGFLASLCVVVAVVVLVLAVVSEDAARIVATFETVIPLPEAVPAFPALLGVLALTMGFAWIMATLAALALARDAPMLPWEHKQYQKLVNDVTRLTTQKAVMERIRNTPAGARPRIATPVPVSARRATPAATGYHTAGTTGLGYSPSVGTRAVPPPLPTRGDGRSEGFARSPTPAGRASPQAQAYEAQPPARHLEGRTPSAGTGATDGQGTRTRTATDGGFGPRGPLAARPLTVSPAQALRSAQQAVPAAQEAAPVEEDAGRAVASDRPYRQSPWENGSAPSPRVLVTVGPSEDPEHPGDDDGTQEAITEVKADPRSNPGDTRERDPREPVKGTTSPWGSPAGDAREPGEDRGRVASPTSAPSVQRRSPPGQRAVPSSPGRSPTPTRAPDGRGGTGIPPFEATRPRPGFRSAGPDDETQEDRMRAAALPGRVVTGTPEPLAEGVDGIFGRVRSGALSGTRPTPYGSAGRVRLPPPAVTVRVGSAEAAQGQYTRGGTPLGAPPKAGVAVGQARRRTPGPAAAPQPTVASTPLGSTRGPHGQDHARSRDIFGTPPVSGLREDPRPRVVAEVEVAEVEVSLSEPRPTPVDELRWGTLPPENVPTVSERRSLPSLAGEAETWLVVAVQKARELNASLPLQASIALSAEAHLPFTLVLDHASPAVAVRAMINFIEFLANVPAPQRARIDLRGGMNLDRSFYKNVEAALEPYFGDAAEVRPGPGVVDIRFRNPDPRWTEHAWLPLRGAG